MERRSRVATLAAILGCLALADLVLGPLLIRLGLAPMTGFALSIGGGLILSIAAFLLGIVGLYLTREGSGASGRSQSVMGILAALGMLGVVTVATGGFADLPPINDITTNFEDPPAFHAAQRDPGNAGRDMAYPPEFADITRGAYPDIAPIELALPPAEALARVEEAAKSLGWEIVEVRADAGELEARQATAIFQFMDDVSVRVRPAEGGSIVDVRSKSRDGRGDIGANAARIRTLRDTLN